MPPTGTTNNTDKSTKSGAYAAAQPEHSKVIDRCRGCLPNRGGLHFYPCDYLFPASARDMLYCLLRACAGVQVTLRFCCKLLLPPHMYMSAFCLNSNRRASLQSAAAAARKEHRLESWKDLVSPPSNARLSWADRCRQSSPYCTWAPDGRQPRSRMGQAQVTELG